MAVFFKAIMGEIVFLVDKCWKMVTPTMEDTRLHDLDRLLLRVLVIVEEAEGRHITNPAMVYQLNLLRKEMYRGYFTMDNLKSQGIGAKSQVVSSSFALSKLNPSKRLFFSTIDAHRDKDLQQVIDNLNNMIRDANSLTMFLKNYPPLYRQPYSMHLFVGKCMFGRQMEMERIMDFLIEREQHLGTGSVQILPIVGPKYVGKSTLVAHICNDARVRNYFSRTVVIPGDDISNKLSTLKDGVMTMHKKNALGENERVLAIVELSGDVDEVAMNSLFLSSVFHLGRGSRMIITSRSNKVIKLGTAQPIVLNFLPPEAYWYFFKILTFGSMNSNDYLELQSIAMEIARGLNGSFISANVLSDILRNNFVAQKWRMYLANCREDIERNVSVFSDEKTCDVIRKSTRPLCWPLKDDEILICYQKSSCLAEENTPTITIENVFRGRVKCEGEFDVLVWKSHIPPYKSYILSCAIESGCKKMKTN